MNIDGRKWGTLLKTHDDTSQKNCHLPVALTTRREWIEFQVGEWGLVELIWA